MRREGNTEEEIQDTNKEAQEKEEEEKLEGFNEGEYYYGDILDNREENNENNPTFFFSLDNTFNLTTLEKSGYQYDSESVGTCATGATNNNNSVI